MVVIFEVRSKHFEHTFVSYFLFNDKSILLCHFVLSASEQEKREMQGVEERKQRMMRDK